MFVGNREESRLFLGIKSLISISHDFPENSGFLSENRRSEDIFGDSSSAFFGPLRVRLEGCLKIEGDPLEPAIKMSRQVLRLPVKSGKQFVTRTDQRTASHCECLLDTPSPGEDEFAERN